MLAHAQEGRCTVSRRANEVCTCRLVDLISCYGPWAYGRNKLGAQCRLCRIWRAAISHIPGYGTLLMLRVGRVFLLASVSALRAIPPSTAAATHNFRPAIVSRSIDFQRRVVATAAGDGLEGTIRSTVEVCHQPAAP